MVKLSKISLFLLIAVTLMCGSGAAKVSQEEARKLKGELTPIGAQRAGNADGTIPEWTGGISTPPKGYVKNKVEPDPYAQDKILLTITSKNLEQYKSKLAAGQLAMFKAYPQTFKMHVYQTRRSAAFPQYVYDAVLKNATNSEINPEDYSSSGWTVAYPFPIPQNGLEVLWNHMWVYISPTGFLRTDTNQAIVNQGGDYTLTRLKESILRPFNVRGTEFTDPMVYKSYFKQETLAPPRQAGRVLVVHDFVDMLNNPRQAWVYNPGQRRVRRAPTVAYDGPGTAADGLRTSDDYGVYNNSPDRYNVTLKGKKEIYIPYNCRKLISKDLKYDEILHAGHINQDVVRYELHRVWVLELTLKEGMRHMYKKRVFYIDEDSWYIHIAESYDKRDQLWRVVMNHAVQHYNSPSYFFNVVTWYDLQSRRYIAYGLSNEESSFRDFENPLKTKDFSPSALRRSGHR